MGWAVGWDSSWGRDIGYGVPATCDQPDCGARIDRGLGYVCGGEPYGGDHGCGLFFCHDHFDWPDDEALGEEKLCERCMADQPPFDPSPDVVEWVAHKLTDPSWAQWRTENPDAVRHMAAEQSTP